MIQIEKNSKSDN